MLFRSPTAHSLPRSLRRHPPPSWIPSLVAGLSPPRRRQPHLPILAGLPPPPPRLSPASPLLPPCTACARNEPPLRSKDRYFSRRRASGRRMSKLSEDPRGWSPLSSPQPTTASSPLRSPWRTAASSLPPSIQGHDEPAGGATGTVHPSHLLAW